MNDKPESYPDKPHSNAPDYSAEFAAARPDYKPVVERDVDREAPIGDTSAALAELAADARTRLDNYYTEHGTPTSGVTGEVAADTTSGVMTRQQSQPVAPERSKNLYKFIHFVTHPDDTSDSRPVMRALKKTWKVWFTATGGKHAIRGIDRLNPRSSKRLREKAGLNGTEVRPSP